MTTEVMGQLPCPECKTTADLKTDGRKHTLKCNACGTLAYYQSQEAKQHIEVRLKESEAQVSEPAENTITLQLPAASEAQQRYLLTIEPLGIDPIEGEMATVSDRIKAANDDEFGEDEPAAKTKDEEKGFFEWMADYL